LPKSPGCYLFKDDQAKILYIGKAKVLRQRVRQYFRESRREDVKVQTMVSKVRDLEVIETDSEVEALILEANLVKEHKPRYNIELKDDKSYPYIKITDELFPRIYVTREKDKSGGKFFGPYTEVKNLRSTLQTLHRIFPIRSCIHRFTAELVESRKVKLCLDYHIHKCEGPCQGLVQPEAYRAMIDQVARFLRGKTFDLVGQLEREMQAHAEEMRFEEAARIRDRMQAIETYTAGQKVMFQDLSDKDILALARTADDACGVVFRVRDGKLIGRQHFYFTHVEGKSEDDVLDQFVRTYYRHADFIPPEIFLPAALEEGEAVRQWLSGEAGFRVEFVVPRIGEKVKLVQMAEKNARLLLDDLQLQKMKAQEQFVPRVLLSLQRDLRLNRVPRRIECFDNSNIQGSDPVASMVVFVDGKPKKSEYRKFRIRTVQGPDDFASMHEVVSRRYLRVLNESHEFPDLIVIDGGKGQLSAAVAALEGLGIEVSVAGSAGQPVLALAKRLEEVFLPGVNEAVMIPKTSSALRLLQHVRDEAHRFAVAFHRTLRNKRTVASELDAIEGIGPKRRQLLFDRFGSVRRLAAATLEEIRAVDGIPSDVAETVHRYFAAQAVQDEQE
jgi:excinuclease ABC subunit C